MSVWVVAGQISPFGGLKLKCSAPKMKVSSGMAYFFVLVAAWQTLSSRSWYGGTQVPV